MHDEESKKIFYITGILFFSALIVRFIGLGKGIWLDEAASLFYAESTVPELIQKLFLGNAPPLYYVALKGWISIFGTSEISLRLPSMISTFVGLIFLYHFLKKFSEKAGTIGALLIAFSPLSIYYSQEARNYAFLFLFLAIYVYCYDGFINDMRKRLYLAGLVACSLLLCLTHNIGFFFIAGMQISLLLVKSGRLRVLWFWGHVVLLVLLSPWLIVLLQQTSRIFTLSWFLPIWESKSILAHFYETFLLFCVGPYPSYLAIGTFSRSIALIISTSCLLIAIYGYISHRKNLTLNGLWWGSGLAVLLLLLFSIIKQPIYIPGRADYFLYPVYVIFLALGISSFKAKYASSLTVLVILIASLLVLVPYYGNDSKNSSKKYVGQLAENINSGDLLITTGLTYLVVKYYLDRSGVDVKIVTYPEATISHPGYFFEKEHADNLSQMADYSRQLLIDVRKAKKMQQKTYIILTPHKINGVLLKELSAGVTFKKIHQADFFQSLMGTPITILSLAEKKI